MLTTNKLIRTILLSLLCIFSSLFFISCTGPQGSDVTGTTASTTAADTDAPTPPTVVGDTYDVPFAADFSVAKVFSSDMVVQRNEHVRIWGWAPESENGKKIAGEFMGLYAEALIEDGAWTLTFAAPLDACADMGNTMVLYADGKTVSFTDVLVGDVYMVIGQSNVAYTMDRHWEFNDIADKGGKSTVNSDAPIRIHYNNTVYNNNDQIDGYPTQGTAEVCPDLRNGSVWQKATLDALHNFSAIGYLFAQQTVALSDGTVPIGIIEVAASGIALGAFLPNEVAEALGTDTFDESRGIYLTNPTKLVARYVYNHYIYPFERYAIAGVLWYQGESDHDTDSAQLYNERFIGLMNHMRSTHNLLNPEFPVYIVEIPTNFPPPKGYDPFAENAVTWYYMQVGLIRAFMGAIPQTLPNSHIVVSSDLFSDETYNDSLHPHCKFEQAQRAAKLVAAVQGKGKLEEAAGPILVSMEQSEDRKTAILTFTNVGEGLMTSDGSSDVLGFATLNYNKRQRISRTYDQGDNIIATITAPNQITLVSDKPFDGIAYNCKFSYTYGKEVTLCNSYGTPACATSIFGEGVQ